MFESLETRRMLSITLAGSRLTVDGSDEADVIIVQQLVSPLQYSIFENGTTTLIESNRILKQIVINGNGDDDTLVIDSTVTVASTLNGGAGDDTMIGGFAADKFIGGDGTDTADYQFRSDNLRLSLNNAADDGKFSEGDNIMTDVENILGGSGNDVIVGNTNFLPNTRTLQAVDNFFDGGAGNDAIRGMDGNDLIFGGLGNDSLDGNGGDDTLAGNAGNDTLLGSDGDDVIEANDGEIDTVIGGAGFDTCWMDSTLVIDNVNVEDAFLI